MWENTASRRVIVTVTVTTDVTAVEIPPRCDYPLTALDDFHVSLPCQRQHTASDARSIRFYRELNRFDSNVA